MALYITFYCGVRNKMVFKVFPSVRKDSELMPLSWNKANSAVRGSPYLKIKDKFSKKFQHGIIYFCELFLLKMTLLYYKYLNI